MASSAGGLSGHRRPRVFFGEHVKGGMFQGVIAPGFQDKGKI
jgi:hypothetical protein